ncbi:hypothetical protein F2P81_015576 [Scophthalmus maximus]|uniref:Uncharacterized protein n=1 Tax=Scophthalmus maximus TaxID=52904 RepID=A0A6A4SDS1_SCOMX|nr:hypothetical protein F2P81_015576 [Scophthalmus maximus]
MMAALDSFFSCKVQGIDRMIRIDCLPTANLTSSYRHQKTNGRPADRSVVTSTGESGGSTSDFFPSAMCLVARIELHIVEVERLKRKKNTSDGKAKGGGNTLCKSGSIAVFGNVVYSGLLNDHLWHLGVPLFTRLKKKKKKKKVEEDEGRKERKKERERERKKQEEKSIFLAIANAVASKCPASADPREEIASLSTDSIADVPSPLPFFISECTRTNSNRQLRRRRTRHTRAIVPFVHSLHFFPRSVLLHCRVKSLTAVPHPLLFRQALRQKADISKKNPRANRIKTTSRVRYYERQLPLAAAQKIRPLNNQEEKRKSRGNQEATNPPEAMAQPYTPAQYPPPPQNGIPAEFAAPHPLPTQDYTGQSRVPEHAMTLYTPTQTHSEPAGTDNSTPAITATTTAPEADADKREDDLAANRERRRMKKRKEERPSYLLFSCSVETPAGRRSRRGHGPPERDLGHS